MPPLVKGYGVEVPDEVTDFAGRVDGGGAKYDADKLRYDLIPPQVLQEDALVYTIGAKKYADNNWMRGIKYTRLIAATFRHIAAWLIGKARNDEDGGAHHLAQARWNLGTLLYFELHKETYGDFDDRAFARRPE